MSKETKILEITVASLENAYDRLADKYHKLLKVLVIIKNKQVCIKWLRNGLVAYNNTAALHDLPRLTEEEFELLKEELL